MVPLGALNVLSHMTIMTIYCCVQLSLLLSRYNSRSMSLLFVSGVLRTFFDVLYDEDIIGEAAFNQWDSSVDPSEQEGKGVARQSTVQFFRWIREAADTDSQEDS